MPTPLEPATLYHMGAKVKAATVSRISAKNQVTLPVRALRAVGLQAGDSVTIQPDGKGRLVVAPANDALERFVGALPGLTHSAALDELRDEWDQ